ncbi:FCD domain-containing protein [Pseudonocardia aurantiaca]|uniref:FadR/GntR family transcriptional regulator n=1 Tax=Pseudonocardia aurantiaca TaxID=75290 RepID=A0ABW4FWE9_9PSEU
MGSVRSTYRPGYEVAAERIIEYIQREGLQPGDRLPTERAMAAVLEVSHTVTREAIKLLSARGHLVTRRGAGIFVAEPSEQLPSEIWGTMLLDNLEHVEMIYESRRAVEAETARLAALRATPQEAQRIRDTAERTVTAAAEDDFVAFFTTDEAFHSAVAAAAHNIFLASIVDNLFGLMHRLKAFGIGEARDAMQRGAAEHSAIAAAILRGEPEAAAGAMHGHIENSVEDYRRLVREKLFSRAEPEQR